MIRVMIVDDERLMRDGLKTLMNLEPDLEVVAEAGNGEEAFSVLAGTPVEVILMDIRMPTEDGISATKRIKAQHPQVKVLMLTTYEDKEDVVGALSAGAAGYLLKDMPAEEIADSIRVAAGGGAVLPPGVANTFLHAVFSDGGETSRGEGGTTGAGPPSAVPADASNLLGGAAAGITDREVDVLNCLAEGLSNREIAARLFVTEGTVKNHVSSLIAKLGLRDRTQVALYAVRHGYGKYV